jgi:hypothetical protein
MKNDIKCSRFHRNKTNNICKTSTRTHIVYLWIELYVGKSNICYYMNLCNAVNQKIFYKDQSVRRRLRRRRRRSRPPIEYNCKTDAATHPLQNSYYKRLIREPGWYGISICYWIHIMLLISHQNVTINAEKVLHSNGIIEFYYKMCYLILYMILWYQKIIESSSTVLILIKIKEIISVRLMQEPTSYIHR